MIDLTVTRLGQETFVVGERQDRALEIFTAARKKTGAEREELVSKMCADDPPLRREVEVLLDTHDTVATDEPLDRVFEIFTAVRGKIGAERDELLSELCAGDHELRRDVEALLDLNDTADRLFVDHPAAGDGARDETHPERVGRYRIKRLIGRGGMGVVYEAEQDAPRRSVALKLMNPFASPGAFRRFELEGELLGRLRHPGIARVFEAGSEMVGGVNRPYLAMELIDGPGLLTHAESLDVRERLELLATIADAVEHAHRRSVIHRDLKPGNILVDETGRPVVLDFGIARVNDEDMQRATMLTREGVIIGTLAYMSPEQASGTSEHVDTRTDVYALGVIAYELLSGKLPLDVARTTLPVAVGIIREQAPPRLSTHDPALAGDIETIVHCALEKEADHRYGSAGAFAEDIRRHLDDRPIHARAPSATYELKKYLRRNKVPVMFAMSALVALIAGIIVTSILLAKALEAEETAKERQQEAERNLEDAEAIIRFLDGLVTESSRLEQGGEELTFRAALDQASEDLEADVGDNPRVLATIHRIFGTDYDSLEDGEAALHHLTRAWDLRRVHLGEKHPDTIEAGMHYGRLLTRVGRTEEALEHFEALLPFAALFVEAHPLLVARTYFTYGETEMYRGRLENAEGQMRRALTIRARAEGGLRLDAEIRAGLAAVLRRRGRLAEGEGYLRQALAIYEEDPGPDSKPTAAIVGNLAVNLKNQGRFEEAEGYQRRGLEILRKLHGEGSAGTLIQQSNFGSLLLVLGKLGEAREVLEANVADHRKHLGEKHRNVGFPLGYLARVHAAAGRWAEAERCLTEALEIWSGFMDAGHQVRLTAQQDLATILALQGKWKEADTYHEKNMTAAAGFEDGRRLFRGRARAGHADMLRHDGRSDEARRIAESVLSEHADDAGSVWAAEMVLGHLAIEAGDPTKAIAAFRRAEAAVKPGRNLQSRRFRSVLAIADVLVAERRSGEALTLLVESRPSAEETLGREHWVTKSIAAAAARLRGSEGERGP